MKRLRATIWCDLRLQYRNGFFYASAVVVIASIILLQWLPDRAVALLLPAIILENVLFNTYYFVAGLILLEKGEGTLEAQIITPLRAGEYLGSKVITLTALSLIESLLISTVAWGVGPGLLPLTIGIAMASVIFCLCGVALAARYDSINEYLLPSVVYTTLLSLPLLGYFGIGPSSVYDVHPVQGPLTLMQAGYSDVGTGRLIYAIIYPLIWMAPIYLWSRHSMRRFVTAAAGAS